MAGCSAPPPPGHVLKRLAKAVALHALLLVVVPFALLEGISRLLPVASPPPLQPVTPADPIAHFQLNTEYVYSAGWNFAIRSRKRSNNYGFSNIADYHPGGKTECARPSAGGGRGTRVGNLWPAVRPCERVSPHGGGESGNA